MKDGAFRIFIVVLLAAGAIFVLGYFVGRAMPSSNPRTTTDAGSEPTHKTESPKQTPKTVHQTPRTQTNKSAVTEKPLAQRLQQIQSDRESMGAVHESIVADLASGKLTLREVIDAVQRETDFATLDMLIGIVREDPNARTDPAMLNLFLNMLRNDKSPERRQASIMFLSYVNDTTGQAKAALMQAAMDPSSPDLQTAAIGAFKEYVAYNPMSAAEVSAQLLMIAKSSTNEGAVVQAIDAVEARDETTLREIAAICKSTTGTDVRLVCGAKLQDVKPEHRLLAIDALSEAFVRETSETGRRDLLTMLVKAGRRDSLDTLERLKQTDPRMAEHINDYLTILRSGELDWDRIMQEKTRLEEQRGR